jgi:hypothetical protein
MLDVLGFHTVAPVTTVNEAFGSTKLVEVGDNFYLYGDISMATSVVWSRAEILPSITSGYGLDLILRFTSQLSPKRLARPCRRALFS